MKIAFQAAAGVEQATDSGCQPASLLDILHALPSKDIADISLKQIMHGAKIPDGMKNAVALLTDSHPSNLSLAAVKIADSAGRDAAAIIVQDKWYNKTFVLGPDTIDEETSQRLEKAGITYADARQFDSSDMFSAFMNEARINRMEDKMLNGCPVRCTMPSGGDMINALTGLTDVRRINAHTTIYQAAKGLALGKVKMEVYTGATKTESAAEAPATTSTKLTAPAPAYGAPLQPQPTA